MGSCAILKKSKNKKEIEEMAQDVAWMRVSGCIDKFTFIHQSDVYSYDEMQYYLSRISLDYHKHTFENQEPEYNHNFVSKNLDKILK